MRKALVGVFVSLLWLGCPNSPSDDNTPPGSTYPLSDGGRWVSDAGHGSGNTDSGSDPPLSDAGGSSDGGILPDAGEFHSRTWILENPLPDLDERRNIWPVSATTFWTASMFKHSLSYFDGTRFHEYDVGAAIEGIWGRSANDIWAVGEGIFHWDGQRWTRQRETSESLMDVWGTDSHVWAVGFSQQLYVYDGNAWTPAPSTPAGNLLNVWASAPDNVWVIANDLGVVGKSSLHHFDGTQWTEHLSDHVLDILQMHSLWGTGTSKDIWLGGMGGDLSTVIAHYDGTSWVLEEHVRSINGVYSLWGSGPSDVYAVTHEGTVLQRSPAGWTRVYAHSDQNLKDARLFGVAGAGAAIYAVGDYGVILNRPSEAAPWQIKQPAGNLGAGTAAIAFRDDDWWRAQGHQIIHEQNGTAVTFSLHDGAQVTGLWGVSSSRLWATLADGAILEFNGAQWLPVYEHGAQTSPLTLTAISGTSASDIWAVGYTDPTEPGPTWVLHWDGAQWQRVPFARGSELSAVLARSPTEVWVGGQNLTARWDGTQWHPSPTQALGNIRSFWSPGPDELWAVGQGLFRWDGNAWELIGGEAPHPPFVGNSLWGTSPTDVYAVGDWGEAIHWDGQTLSALQLPIRGHFYKVFGTGKQVHILGERGIRLLRNE